MPTRQPTIEVAAAITGNRTDSNRWPLPTGAATRLKLAVYWLLRVYRPAFAYSFWCRILAIPTAINTLEGVPAERLRSPLLEYQECGKIDSGIGGF